MGLATSIPRLQSIKAETDRQADLCIPDQSSLHSQGYGVKPCFKTRKTQTTILKAQHGVEGTGAQPQRQLHSSFSPNSGEWSLEVAPNLGWWCALVFLPWNPPLRDSSGPSVLPRLLLPRDELSNSTPECARVMLKSSSAPSSSAGESIIRRVGPGQGWLLYTLRPYT